MRRRQGEREWPELVDRIGKAGVDQLATVRCPPILVARWLSDGYVAEARAGRLPEHRLAAIDVNLQNIIDWFGGCERTRTTSRAS